MIGVVTRAGSLAPYLRGATVTVTAGVRPPVGNLVPPSEKSPFTPSAPDASTVHTMTGALPPAALRIVSGPSIKTQVRYAHTDLRVPDFTPYRLKSGIDPAKASTQGERNKGITYLVSAAGTVTSLYLAKNIVYGIVSFMAPSADVLALGKIEVNLNEIPEGKSVVFKWRGKPLFIRHRTATEITKEQTVDPSTLRDQEHDSVRVKDPKWLIVIGVCTHLGCIPIANAGDFGGYYCPCHGSHYDASGRIRKGPAPLNLEVPFYQFMEGGSKLVVG